MTFNACATHAECLYAECSYAESYDAGKSGWEYQLERLQETIQKVVWAEFSTLSLTVFVIRVIPWHTHSMPSSTMENSAQVSSC
jgi:hypothetical protein